MIRSFETLMSEVRATFDLFAGGAIDKAERTRLLVIHATDADKLRHADAHYVHGYIDGRRKAQDAHERT